MQQPQNPEPDVTRAGHAALSPRQIHVLHHLLSGKNVKESARAVGVHRSSIYVWRQQDAFRHHYDKARFNGALAAADRLIDMVDVAQGAIFDILTDSDASPSARLRAARMVIETALLPLHPAEIEQNSTRFDTGDIILSSSDLEEPEVEAPAMPADPVPGQAEPPSPETTPNEACPCGSGIKYEMCCSQSPAPEQDPGIESLLAGLLSKQPPR